MKILLSAFACDPNIGSEDGMGWGMAINLARKHRVHVLTACRHRESIETYLRLHPADGISFSYFDFPAPLLRAVFHTALWQLYYHCWQLRIARWAAPVAAKFDPDLVHHITYGRYWTPTSLWRLGKPLVWGPVGGGDFCPAALLPALSRSGRWSEKFRALAQALAHRDPALQATAREAALAIASTVETQKRLEILGCRRMVLMMQNAIDTSAIDEKPAVPVGLVFCSLGRLLDWKGQGLTLRAFAEANIAGARLIILGEGPARQRLGVLAKDLRIHDRVEFRGFLPRAAARDVLRSSLALVHPSLHDQAPTVVLEAMSVGTPVIGLALGGITMQVDAESGILITPACPRQVIAQLAQAMRSLADDPVLQRRLSEASWRRIRQYFTWTRKIEIFEAIYRSVLCPDALSPEYLE